MPKSGLAGSRIRERRLDKGHKQADLARAVGISPAYLNLIEHNKRRIGGKLLIDLARELDVEATTLTEGAQTALLVALSGAAAGFPGAAPEVQGLHDMAGRFPGWAALIAAQHRRTQALERTVEALTDRLTHDPQLAASMHEMLSVVTAIRSTSAILAQGGQIDRDWQARFHRNLYEDSQRLAASAQALVQYLDASDSEPGQHGPALPQEDLEIWLEARGHHVAELETGDVSVAALLDGETQLRRAATTAALARTYLERYARDARKVPMEDLRAAIERDGVHPLALAERFGCDMATVLRRIACLPRPKGAAPVGLVVCDGSGTLTYRKPIEGFALPRYGAACPLWPLYQALSCPMTPMRHLVEQAGHQPRRFVTYAVALPNGPGDFDAPRTFEATMLILPEDGDDAPAAARTLPIGSSCRICQRTDCSARREASILTDGF
jgi:XRE family transcriptional regulator, fatty acid utilization regulator